MKAPPVLPTLMVLLVSLGLYTHKGFNYLPRGAKKLLDGPFIYGLVILFHSMYGASGLIEKPKFIDAVQKNTVFKWFTLLLLSYAAVRDVEDALFLTVLFLGLTQISRDPEERKRHPYIL